MFMFESVWLFFPLLTPVVLFTNVHSFLSDCYGFVKHELMFTPTCWKCASNHYDLENCQSINLTISFWAHEQSHVVKAKYNDHNREEHKTSLRDKQHW